MVTHYSREITTIITDTVERWDAEETSRKIELQVGRDLQFIRINGTVVGALAGLAIYSVRASVVLSVPTRRYPLPRVKLSTVWGVIHGVIHRFAPCG